MDFRRQPSADWLHEMHNALSPPNAFSLDGLGLPKKKTEDADHAKGLYLYRMHQDLWLWGSDVRGGQRMGRDGHFKLCITSRAVVQRKDDWLSLCRSAFRSLRCSAQEQHSVGLPQIRRHRILVPARSRWTWTCIAEMRHQLASTESVFNGSAYKKCMTNFFNGAAEFNSYLKGFTWKQ